MTAVPAWHPDPTGRHQYRWWDGTSWTARVADDGRESVDPMPPSPVSQLDPSGSAESTPSSSRAPLVLALIGGVVLLAVIPVIVISTGDDEGVGGGSGDLAAGRTCDLLTTPQVSEAVGQVMGDVEVEEDPSLEPGVEACAWKSTESSASESIVSPLKVTTTVGDLTPEVSAIFDDVEANGRGFRVAGIGDDALVSCGLVPEIGSGCRTYGPLLVASGDRYLTVEMSNFATPDDFDKDEVQTVLENMARTAVEAL